MCNANLLVITMIRTRLEHSGAVVCHRGRAAVILGRQQSVKLGWLLSLRCLSEMRLQPKTKLCRGHRAAVALYLLSIAENDECRNAFNFVASGEGFLLVRFHFCE